MEKPKQITLGMDSSGPTLAVCASDGAKITALHHTGIKQEPFLLPLVQRLLQKAGAELTDVKKVFIVRGPGRFTGIRISLTFASMLKYLNGASVSGATLFDILYYQSCQSRSFATWKKENPSGVLAVVLHAFREEYFLQIFDGTGAGPVLLGQEELLARLAERSEPLYCAGVDKDGASLAALLGDKYRLAPLAECRVQPQTLIALSADPAYEKDALEPLYLKPARFELGQ